MTTTHQATGHLYDHFGTPYAWIWSGFGFGFWYEGADWGRGPFHPWPCSVPPNWLMPDMDYVGPISIHFKQK